MALFLMITAYLRSHPEVETEIIERIPAVLIWLQGTKFESTTYDAAIGSFHHLFCTRECFQNCVYGHVTFRRKIIVSLMNQEVVFQ